MVSEDRRWFVKVARREVRTETGWECQLSV